MDSEMTTVRTQDSSDSRRTGDLGSDRIDPLHGTIFLVFRLSAGSTLLFLVCSKGLMNERPASWRMPTEKQMEKLAAAAVGKNAPPRRAAGPRR